MSLLPLLVFAPPVFLIALLIGWSITDNRYPRTDI